MALIISTRAALIDTIVAAVVWGMGLADVEGPATDRLLDVGEEALVIKV